MKTLVLFVGFMLMLTLGISQNILEALALKDNLLGAYVEGETRSTDTLIDLSNGYYEEFFSAGASNKTIIRQAAVFKNHDGSTTLGVSTTSWDFQCYTYQTNFYEIPEGKDSLKSITNDKILPSLAIREFISDSTIFPVLSKYLPAIQKNYLGTDATIDEFLSELFDIAYLLPQKGTRLLATLRLCDYIPTNEVNISPNDWAIIENVSGSIELAYDKTRKIFRKP